MKLGIVGSRTFDNHSLFYRVVMDCLKHYNIDEIISGGAKGADQLAEELAGKLGIKMTIHKAEWEKYGVSAGFKRNQLIWNDSDIIIAFWDGKSKGTKHTIDNYKGKLFVIMSEDEYIINQNALGDW